MQLGFASRMIPREKLMETAYEIAATMAGKSPIGLQMIQRGHQSESGGIIAGAGPSSGKPEPGIHDNGHAGKQ